MTSEYSSSRSLPTSSSPAVFSSQYVSRLSSPLSAFAFAVSSFRSLPPRRRFVLLAAFIAGVLLTATMKREAFLWLLSANAGANALVGYGQGSNFDYPGLRFGMDRKFRITMFNDLHLGDGARPGTDDKTIGVMTGVLDTESGTDLVVFNGDLTSCEWLAQASANDMLDKMVDPLIARRTPFAVTFGNHDMSTTCNTRNMSDYMWHRANKGMGHGGKQLSWTAPSVVGEYEEVGTSNFYIPVYGMGGGGNPDLKMILWFFDSRGGRRYQPGGADVPVQDWVGQKVISWFTLTRDQIQATYGDRVIPSLAFVHIPPSVTLKFQRSGQYKASTEPGLNEDIIATQADNTEGADIPFLTALVETKGLMAVFSGHDHGIDWCMKYSATKPIHGATPPTGNNMHICFGRHTGYGGYSDWMRGGRRIIVDEDMLGHNILETWVRLEDGSISGHVTLNETYGSDRYPFVQKKESPSYEKGVVVEDLASNGTVANMSVVQTQAQAQTQTQMQPSDLGNPSTTTATSIVSKMAVSPTANTVSTAAITASTATTASTMITESTELTGWTQARHTANASQSLPSSIAPKEAGRI